MMKKTEKLGVVLCFVGVILTLLGRVVCNSDLTLFWGVIAILTSAILMIIYLTPQIIKIWINHYST